MFYVKESLLGRTQDLEFFNNLASFGDSEGRLAIWLQLDPSVQLLWEFEPSSYSGPLDLRAMQSPRRPLYWVQPKQFPYESPDVYSIAPRGRGVESGSLPGARMILKGFVGSVRYVIQPYMNWADIYFANTRFMGILNKWRSEPERGRLSVDLSPEWRLGLESPQEFTRWASRDSGETGSQICAVVHLEAKHSEPLNPAHFSHDPSPPQNIPVLQGEEHREFLLVLGQLFSFINGGHTHPLYMYAGRARARMSNYKCFAELFPGPVTPVEYLGETFYVEDLGDLEQYLMRFETLRRMMQDPVWEREWSLLLELYFQAVQPSNLSTEKLWELRANSIGTALERLALVISAEMAKVLPRYLDKKIEAVLDTVGIVRDAHEDGLIGNFQDTRNNATHAQNRGSLTADDRQKAIERACQWFEEILLWRLGYGGQYLDRLTRLRAPHRYDLGLRNPAWDTVV